MQNGEAYFLYHSIGIYPGKDRDLAAAMADFAAHWGAADDGQWGYVMPLRQRFIDRWRALIGAPEGTLTTAENVTAAFHALVTALPESRLKGKRVLVAADCFPSLHFLLAGLAPRLGFTLDTVPLRQGASWVQDEDFLDRWGPDVGLALLTWVSSTSSHRLDLAPLVAQAREMGSLVGVDITQAAGLLPFSVAEPAVDFAISTSLKWMCGTPGAGILQVSAPPDRGLPAGASRLVQPARSLLLGARQLRLRPRRPPLRSWHAGHRRSAGEPARARLARGPGPCHDPRP